jgi:hypothetical protein
MRTPIAVCWLCLAGCAPAIHSAPHVPLHVEWRVKHSEPGALELVARVEMHSPAPSDVVVTVRVPPGVTLVRGAPFVLPRETEPGVREEEFDFTYAVTPGEDLVLVADAQGPSAGVHAEDAYRFGRPPPSQVVPQPTGPRVVVGTHDLGKSIPLQPDPPRGR